MKNLIKYNLIALGLFFTVTNIASSQALASVGLNPYMIPYQNNEAKMEKTKQRDKERALKAQSLNFLKDLRVYTNSQILLNRRSLKQAKECFGTPESRTIPECQSIRSFAFDEILPAYFELRINKALAKPAYVKQDPIYDSPFALNFQPTQIDRFSDLDSISAIMNTKPKYHFNEYHSDVFGTQLPKIAELQPLSQAEIMEALSIRQTKLTQLEGEFLNSLDGSIHELARIDAEDKAKNEDELDKYIVMFENHYHRKMEYFVESEFDKFRKKSSDERESEELNYEEKYIEIIEKYPVLAFINLVEDSSQAANAYQQCIQLARKNSAREDILFASLDDKLDNPESQQLLQKRTDICNQMASRPSYSHNAEDYEVAFQKAFAILYQINLDMEQALFDSQEEDLYKKLLPLAGMGEAIHRFANEENKGKNYGTSTIVTYEDIATHIIDDLNSKEMIEDFTYAGYLIAGIAGCFFVGSKLGPLVFAAKQAATKIIGKIAGALFCSFAPSYGADYFFLRLTENRYKRAFNEMFSSYEGKTAMQDIAKLNDRDQQILLEYIFIGGATVTPSIFGIIKTLPTQTKKFVTTLKGMLK